MATASLNASARSDRGTGVARKLRQAGQVPAVIYGHGREPQSLALVTRAAQIQLAVTASRVELTLARAVPGKIAASVPTRTLTLTGFRNVLLGFGHIDPQARRGNRYRSLTDVRVLHAQDDLDGEDVVPGFRCRLSEIFP